MKHDLKSYLPLFLLFCSIETTASSVLPKSCRPDEGPEVSALTIKVSGMDRIKKADRDDLLNRMRITSEKINQFYASVGFRNVSPVRRYFLRQKGTGTIHEIYKDFFDVNLNKCARDMNALIVKGDSESQKKMILTWAETFFMLSKNDRGVARLIEIQETTPYIEFFQSYFSRLFKTSRDEGFFSSDIANEQWIHHSAFYSHTSKSIVYTPNEIDELISIQGDERQKRIELVLTHESGHHYVQTIVSQTIEQAAPTGLLHEVWADYFAAAMRNDPDMIVRRMDRFSSFDLVQDTTRLANKFYEAGHPLRYILWSLRSARSSDQFRDFDQRVVESLKTFSDGQYFYPMEATRATWSRMTMDYLSALRSSLNPEEQAFLDELIRETKIPNIRD